MKRCFTLLFFVACALAVTWPVAANATLPNNSSDTYQLFMDVPNVSQDAAGDTLGVTGHGTWSVHPKSTDISGAYTFVGADGTSFSVMGVNLERRSDHPQATPPPRARACPPDSPADAPRHDRRTCLCPQRP